MCGIYGCIGHDVTRRTLDGLKRLEYRGYDSCGLVIIDSDSGELNLYRRVGSPSENSFPDFTGDIAIGHTRWATHGGVTEWNAHPHMDCSGRLAVVHNGTLNNWEELKEELEREDHTFTSETDTEVITHLIERYARNQTLEVALERAIQDLNGSFAIAAVSLDEPDKIVAARNFNPLILGVGENSMYVSSDIPSLSADTRLIVPLERDEMAVLNRSSYRIYSLRDGRQIQRGPFEADIRWKGIDKGDKETFTEAEISEQPDRLLDCLSVTDAELNPLVDGVLDSERLYISAAGTSYYAGLVFSYLLSMIGIPSTPIVSSEFQQRAVIGRNTTTLFLSQSGSTSDTNRALDYAAKRNGRNLGVVNVIGSDMARAVDHVAYTRSGSEIGVASTKNFLNQVYLLQRIWLELRNRLDLPTGHLREEYYQMGDHVRQLLETYGRDSDIWERLIPRILSKDPIVFGSGISYPVALEAALKLKELSYLNVNAYPSGEFKHGPLALIEPRVPVIGINPTGDEKVFNRTRTNMEQVGARGGYGIIVGDYEQPYDEIFYTPQVPYPLSPITSIVPLQLLALYVSEELGRDIDKPRNLAKSVTVE